MNNPSQFLLFQWGDPKPEMLPDIVFTGIAVENTHWNSNGTH